MSLWKCVAQTYFKNVKHNNQSTSTTFENTGEPDLEWSRRPSFSYVYNWEQYFLIPCVHSCIFTFCAFMTYEIEKAGGENQS